MKISETKLKGAFLFELEPIEDERGCFYRTFCREELKAIGVEFTVAQCSSSFNKTPGILRGMCYQTSPAEETKIVRCTKGAIYDVIIDLCPESPSYLQHFGVYLSAKLMNSLLIPKRFAHGFLTMEPETEVQYMMDEFYAPQAQRGIRYDDPAFGINWPAPVQVIADKDLKWPLFDKASILK